MKKIFIFICIIFSLAFVYQRSTYSWVRDNPNGALRSAPLQTTMVLPSAFQYKDYTITPLANFKIKARVLGRKRYLWGREADLVPTDLALGWGIMSSFDVIDQLRISQHNRWYYYWYKEPPIIPSEIVAHSANMHLIPSNKDIAKAIKKVKKGEIVSFEGYLVKATAQDGWRWTSSLSRTDSGANSCELVWVAGFSQE